MSIIELTEAYNWCLKRYQEGYEFETGAEMDWRWHELKTAEENLTKEVLKD